MIVWWRLYKSARVQSDSFVAWRHNMGRGHKVAYVESSEQAVAATVNNGWRAPDEGYVAALFFFQGVRPHGSRLVAASTGRSRMARAPSHFAGTGERWASEGTRTVPASKPLLPTSRAHLWGQQCAKYGYSEKRNGRLGSD